MATPTIAQIKELREATAAGMGACKEALIASDCNMEAAVKYLREKGLAVAAKRVDKESKQGIVALAEAADKKSMALAEVNCEPTSLRTRMRTRSSAPTRPRSRSKARTSKRRSPTTTRCCSRRRART